ncbi:hypothetical protein J4416_01410 [Candidatus Pacearchaeota archaeon]|nr:hypothetical protein [Candidatus Pacearchaeota archaeon]
MELVERTLEFDVERMISGRVNSFKRCAIGFFRSSRVLERSQLITALTKSGICEDSIHALDPIDVIDDLPIQVTYKNKWLEIRPVMRESYLPIKPLHTYEVRIRRYVLRVVNP